VIENMAPARTREIDIERNALTDEDADRDHSPEIAMSPS
jgi:hypothetical protein